MFLSGVWNKKNEPAIYHESRVRFTIYTGDYQANIGLSLIIAFTSFFT